MDSRRSNISPAAAQALTEAMRRPPLRVTMRHEPCDRIDAFPTVTLSPCGTASAMLALDRAMRWRGTKLLIGGARFLDERSNAFTNAMRDRCEGLRLGSSLLVDTAAVIDIGRIAESRLTVASVDGPVDASDARAIESAIAGATPPLDADLRASAVLQCGTDRQVWAQFRDITIARRFLAALVTHYVARVLDEPMDALPFLDLETLRLPVPGFTIRPRDVRVDGCSVNLTVRAAAGRTMLRLTADRSTGRWYA
jgi:hypothetical protein